MGWGQAPPLTLMSNIKKRFRVRNVEQFNTTFTDEEEFFAYMTEALHSRPRGWSKHGLVYESCAFPFTLQELRQMDDGLLPCAGIVWDCKFLQSRLLDYHANDYDCLQKLQKREGELRKQPPGCSAPWSCAAEGHAFVCTSTFHT